MSNSDKTDSEIIILTFVLIVLVVGKITLRFESVDASLPDVIRVGLILVGLVILYKLCERLSIFNIDEIMTRLNELIPIILKLMAYLVISLLLMGFLVLLFTTIFADVPPYIPDFVISLGFIGLLLYLLISKYNHQDDAKSDHPNGFEIKSDDSEAFKFTLTLLATLATVLYTSYNYVQTNAINALHHTIIYTLISGILIFIILSVIYVILKALAMGPLDNRNKNCINWISARLFLFNIIISLSLLLLFGYFISAAYVLIGLDNFSSPLFLIGCAFAVCGIVLLLAYIYRQSLMDKLLVATSICIVIFIVWSPIYFTISESPILLGYITVDINDVYSNSDTRIPFTIQITGPNTDLHLKLNNETQNKNLKKTWDITLSSGSPTYNESEDKSLTGYSLGNGAYIAYIDTSTLPAGYYKLNCTRKGYAQSYTAKGFYISDSREMNAYNY